MPPSSKAARPHGGLKTWLKVLLPVLASLLGLGALRFLGPDIINQQQVHAWLVPFGRWAPVAFIAFLAIRPVTLLPGQFFTAVGGLMFGAVWATVFSLVGHLFASGVIYLLAKKVGGPWLRRAMGNRYPALQRAARHHDFKYSVLTCINPLLPTDVAQAAAAASGARFWPVALGTSVGSIPGTYLTAAFGSSLGQGRTVTPILMAVGLVVSLVLGAFLGRSVYREVRDAAPEPSAAPEGQDASPVRLPQPTTELAPGA